MRIYLIGCIIAVVLGVINYILFLLEYKPNYSYKFTYIVELMSNIIVIGLTSWYGILICTVSIIQYLKK